MKKYLLLAALFCFTVLSHGVNAAEVGSPKGLWLTQNKRSVIDVYDCAGGALCGRIHWIIAGGMSVDSKNPDASLRTRKMCGLEILNGFKPSTTKNVWDNGKIYKADEGDTYNALITALPDGTLKLRGYVGIPLLGKTQIWTRVNAADYPACK